jgi:hypothetical protein
MVTVTLHLLQMIGAAVPRKEFAVSSSCLELPQILFRGATR